MLRMWLQSMRAPLQSAVWPILNVTCAPASASANAGAPRRRTQLATRTSELLLEEAAPVRRLALHEPSGALWVATTATAARRWRVPPPPPALGAAPAPGAAPAGARAPAGGAGGAGGRMFVVGALPLVRARQSFDGGAPRRPLAPARPTCPPAASSVMLLAASPLCRAWAGKRVSEPVGSDARVCRAKCPSVLGLAAQKAPTTCMRLQTASLPCRGAQARGDRGRVDGGDGRPAGLCALRGAGGPAACAGRGRGGRARAVGPDLRGHCRAV